MNEQQIKTWKGSKSFSDSDICRNEESRNAASQEKEMVKCLICLQTTTDGYYCFEHNKSIQAAYEVWKWEQERETRLKLSQAVKHHLENAHPEHTCQPTHCFGLKEIIEKEVFHG